MLVKFKRPVKIDSIHYKETVNVPDEMADHWYFKALQKDGDVLIQGQPVVLDAPTESPPVKPLLKKAKQKGEETKG